LKSSPVKGGGNPKHIDERLDPEEGEKDQYYNYIVLL